MSDELNEKRAAIVAKKNAVNDLIMAINGRLISRLSRDEYARLKTEKNELIRKMQKLETELTNINTERHAAANNQKAEGGVSGTPIVRQIIELRNHYQDFAADGTRSPTMRRMASELVLKLNPIIRAAISKKTGGQS